MKRRCCLSSGISYFFRPFLETVPGLVNSTHDVFSAGGDSSGRQTASNLPTWEWQNLKPCDPSSRGADAAPNANRHGRKASRNPLKGKLHLKTCQMVNGTLKRQYVRC